MTDKDHVYQNSLAERVNGILKQEFDIDIGFDSLKEARFVINRSYATTSLMNALCAFKKIILLMA